MSVNLKIFLIFIQICSLLFYVLQNINTYVNNYANVFSIRNTMQIQKMIQKISLKCVYNLFKTNIE